MKIKSIITIVIIVFLYSCGSKKAALSEEELVIDIKSYITSVDKNGSLKKEVTEGALTDANGFKDIGNFKYTVYYNVQTKELFKIENVEKTNKTISENYYFKNQKLVFVNSISGNVTKKIHLKNDKVISEENANSDDQQLLIEKAKRFQKAFQKNH